MIEYFNLLGKTNASLLNVSNLLGTMNTTLLNVSTLLVTTIINARDTAIPAGLYEEK